MPPGVQIMRRHEQLEHASLCCRMTVHGSRTPVDPCQYEKQMLRLTALLDSLDKQVKDAEKVPSETSLRQDACGCSQGLSFVW